MVVKVNDLKKQVMSVSAHTTKTQNAHWNLPCNFNSLTWTQSNLSLKRFNSFIVLKCSGRIFQVFNL